VLAETRSETGTTATTVSEPPKSYPGYSYAPIYPGSMPSASLAGDGSTHLKLYYTANQNTPYKVEHYQVNAAGVAALKNTDNKAGVTDTPASYTARNYPGYTLKLSHPGTVASGIIAGNGSLVLKLYYTANTNTPYKATHYKVVNGVQSTALEKNLTGTTTAMVSEAPISIPGYSYAPSYIGTLTSAPIAGDGSTHLKLYYTANANTPYRVEHYTVDDADNRVLRDSEALSGTTDTPASYTLREYQGYMYDASYPLSTAGAAINGDGTTVVRLYYVVTYQVDFLDWDDSPISNQEVIKGGDAEEPPAPARAGHIFYSWDGDWHDVDSNRIIKAVYIPADWQYQDPPAPAPEGTGGTGTLTRPTLPADVEPEEPAEQEPVEEIIPTPEPPPTPEVPIVPTPPPLTPVEVNNWALLNLILTVLTLATAIMLLISYFTGRRDEDEDDGTATVVERHLLMRILGLVVAAGAITLFLLTENMTYQMTLFDKFTLFHVAILVVQLVLALLSRKRYAYEDVEM
jgi:hypothetical protein